MKQRQLTFDDVPRAMESLLEKVERLESLLIVRNDNDVENRQSEIMDVREVAKFLNLTTSGIYAKVHRKEIPFIKLQDSNRVRFSRKQINAWLMDSQRQAA